MASFGILPPAVHSDISVLVINTSGKMIIVFFPLSSSFIYLIQEE